LALHIALKSRIGITDVCIVWVAFPRSILEVIPLLEIAIWCIVETFSRSIQEAAIITTPERVPYIFPKNNVFFYLKK
jgi:hypothetical protein